MDKTCIIYTLATKAEFDRLKAMAADHGHSAITVFDSAATAPGQGAGWQALVRMVSRGSVQMVIVPTLTVLGSGLDDLVKLVAMMAEKGVDLLAVDEGIDTTTPEGRAWMASIVGLQRYRQGVRKRKARAGQLRAKGAGVRFGRPPVADHIIYIVRKALADGAGIRPTARKLGISASRVAAEKAAMAVSGIPI